MTLEFDEICSMKKVMLSPHFSLNEFTNSLTASRYGINNTPSVEVISNMRRLCSEVLEPLRVAVCRPFFINSGYRCPKLNVKVGGVKNSQHLQGLAADISVTNFTGDDIFKIFCLLHKLPFDQAIYEIKRNKLGRVKRWLHISISSVNRREFIGWPYDHYNYKY